MSGAHSHVAPTYQSNALFLPSDGGAYSRVHWTGPRWILVTTCTLGSSNDQIRGGPRAGEEKCPVRLRFCTVSAT